MPQVNLPPSQYVQRYLQGLSDQIEALGRQQGTVVVDSQLRVRVQVGLLANGDYGILLVDTQGNQQELLPAVRSFNVSTLSVTSTSYSSPAGSPSVTAVLGQSGDALITVCANIGTTNVNDTGQVGITVDGGTTYNVLLLGDTAGIVQGSCSLEVSVVELVGAPLTPGTHTFTMAYAGSTAGHTFQFGHSSLVVQPT